MEFKDYYQTLGVAKGASAAELKRAFRKLARASHPDLHAGDAGAEARFKDINEAYEVLGTPETRRKYDELGANWRAYEQTGRSGTESAAHWSAPFGGGARRTTYRTVDPNQMRDLFGAEDPFSDFFHTFFGGRSSPDGQGPTGRGRDRRGQDVEHAVDLTLEDAFSGTTRRVRLEQSGEARTVEVRIPAGVREGTKVRAAGEGGAGHGEGTAGDLLLTVRVLPHARFERRGQDLHTRVEVPVTTAILGGEMAVTTLAGSVLRLKIPPLSPGGRQFRLKGHGMPSPRLPEERGDLYARLEVALPSTLSDDARAHYEALRALEEQQP